jgi:hypothetical protein
VEDVEAESREDGIILQDPEDDYEPIPQNETSSKSVLVLVETSTSRVVVGGRRVGTLRRRRRWVVVVMGRMVGVLVRLRAPNILPRHSR